MKSDSDLESLLSQTVDDAPTFNTLSSESLFVRMQSELAPRRTKTTFAQIVFFGLVIILSAIAMSCLSVEVPFIALALVLNAGTIVIFWRLVQLLT